MRQSILIIIISVIIFLLPINSLQAYSGELTDRLAQYPNWNNLPNVNLNLNDLFYPDWMAGTWNVTSILTDQVAPLAPEIVTPGFEKNQGYLHQPINFKVRFQPKSLTSPSIFSVSSLINKNQQIVADRQFNGMNIAQAYLGENGVLSIKADPKDPNRQITFFPGNNQLISNITGRNQETPNNNEFVTTEITQQIFQGNTLTYLNQVETTTAYYQRNSDHIEVEQVTAIYLSPQDPDYFKAINRPVSLYRYHLELQRLF